LLSLGKDYSNPIEIINNFLREHMPTDKNSNKNDFSKLKDSLEPEDHRPEIEDQEPNNIDSIDEVKLLITNYRHSYKN
jgi:hypothetical protein